MKIAIVSHTPIDQIEGRGAVETTLGGPTSYGGLTARELGFDVRLVTRIGRDFPGEFRELLRQRGLEIPSECISTVKPSTRFRLVLRDDGRELFLLAKCDDLAPGDVKVDADAFIVSPIINEVPEDALMEVHRHTGFLFLDPQGFLRRVGEGGRVYSARTEIGLEKAHVNAIKVDDEEVQALTGSAGTDGLMKLRTSIAILTRDNRTTMLYNDRLYELETGAIDARDSTGLGDIFAAAYACTFASEPDAVWALCNAVAASQAAIRTGETGISKIPRRQDLEKEASALSDKVIARRP